MVLPHVTSPFVVGDRVWYAPPVLGYGYDYPGRGIPAIVHALAPSRIAIRFVGSGPVYEGGTRVYLRYVSPHHLSPRQHGEPLR